MSIILADVLYPPDSWGYERAGEIQRRERGPGMGRRKIKREEREKRGVVLFFSAFAFYWVQK